MQKKLIALAVAGLVSGGAFAQSNVTVYGIADVYGVAAKADNATDQKQTGIQSGGLSGSRIGFKGEEALGNGLKAVFTLEYQLAVDGNAGVGTGTLAARQQYVGLSSNTLGTVVAGRLQTLGYDFAAKYDTFGAAVFSPVGQLQDAAGLLVTARGANGRQNNAVAYISPSFAGVTVKANYAFGEQVRNATVDKAQGIFALGADYDNGPLSVGVAYVQADNVGGTNFNTDEQKAKEYAVAAGYDFGVAKLNGGYQYNKASAGSDDDKTKLWNIGVSVPVTAAGSVKVAYANIKVTNNYNAAELKANSWGVDYEHNLSKRTTAYVGYSRISNKSDTAYSLANTGVVVQDGGSVGQFGVGVRHAF